MTKRITERILGLRENLMALLGDGVPVNKLANELIKQMPEATDHVSDIDAEINLMREEGLISTIDTAAIPPAFIQEVLQILASNNRDKDNVVSEQITKFIEEHNSIHTVRSDIEPVVYIYRDGIYVPEGKTYVKELCRAILGQAYTVNLANKIIEKIIADTYIDAEEFYAVNDIDEIAVENGILNLGTKELTEFTPKKIFFNKLLVTYDSAAVCPAIEKHFDTVLKNPEEDKKVAFEWIGYTLHRDYPINKALMMSGDGRNGKTITIKAWKTFLGFRNVASIAIQELEEQNFARSELLNKLANLAGDIPKKKLKTTGYFKKFTGNDPMTVDVKFKPRVTFTSYAKQIFSANEIPMSMDDTDAFWARWVILDFPYKFVSQKEHDAAEDKTNLKVADTGILSKLTTPEELSGLLNKALDGLDRLLKQGDFSYSKTIAQVKDLWVRRSNNFQAFLMDETETTDDDGVPKEELRKAYKSYCSKNRLKPVDNKILLNTLLDAGIFEARPYIGEGDDKKQIRVWSGIKLKLHKFVELNPTVTGPCSYCRESKELAWKDEEGYHLCNKCKLEEETI